VLRVLFLGGVVTLLAALALTLYVTRSPALARQLEAALLTTGFEVTRLGEVQYSPPDSIEIHDLVLKPVVGSAAADVLPATGEWPALSARFVRLRCDPGTLLSGHFDLREVFVQGLRVTLLRKAGEAAGSWGELTAGGGLSSESFLFKPYYSALERLRIDNIDLQIFERREPDRTPRLVRRLACHARAERTSTPAGDVFQFALRRAGSGQTLSRWDWTAGGLRFETDWAQLETIAALLPAQLQPLWQRCGPRGLVRVANVYVPPPADRVEATAAARLVATTLLEMSELDLAVPFEDARDCPKPEDCFVRLRRGSAMLAYDGAAVRGELSGEFNGAPGALRFATLPLAPGDRFANIGEWLAEAELKIDGIDLPTVREDAAFVHASRMPSSVRSFFREYGATGPVRVQFEFSRPGGANAVRTAARSAAGPLEVSGTVEALGVRLRYIHFPYDIANLRGFLRVSRSGIELDNLRGQHAGGFIHANGHLAHQRHWTAFDLAISGAALTLDQDLYAALPSTYRDLWDGVTLLGVCDVATQIHRPEGSAELGPAPLHIQVDADLRGGSLAADQNRRLTAATGHFSIADGVIQVHDLQGYLDGALVRTAGTIDASRPGEPPLTDLRITAADMPIQEHVPGDVLERLGSDAGARLTASATAAEPPASTANVGEVVFAGWGDVSGTLRGAGLLEGPESRYTVVVKDGTLSSFRSRQPWQSARGRLTRAGDRLVIHEFAATRDDARLQFSGDLRTAREAPEVIDLTLTASDRQLETLMPRLVPPQLGWIAEALGLSGSGELALRYPGSGESDAVAREATLHLRANAMRPTVLPLAFENVEADLRVGSEGFELGQATATCGADGQIRMTGRGGWRDQVVWSELQVAASDLTVGPDFIAALPGPLADLLGRLVARGNLSLSLEPLKLESPGGHRWSAAGRLACRDASLEVGLALTELAGALTGHCTVDAAGHVDLGADLEVTAGRIAGRPLAQLTASLRYRPDDPSIVLDRVSGQLCGGQVLGTVRIDPATRGYELSLALRDLDFDQFALRARESGESQGAGRLDGRVFVRGQAGDDGSRRGGGDVRIRGASLLRTPVVASVAQAAEQADHALGQLERVDLRFVWNGPRLEFNEVSIETRDMRLVGSGYWNMADDTIDLTLVGAHPSDWPRILILTELFESAGQEILRYRVLGTVAHPDVSTEPLYSLSEPLRQMLDRAGANRRQ